MNEIAIRANAPLPATYEQAKAALAECERIDECKDWADRAMALSSYARQAKDTAMFDAALRIQLRATERMGELLAAIEDAKGRPKSGGGAPTNSGRLSAGKDAGLSKDQTIQALRIAAVPKEERDALIEGTNPPTVTELAEVGTKKKPERVKQEPYSDDWCDWAFPIRDLATLPECGLKALAQHPLTKTTTVDRMLREARAVITNIGQWVDELEKVEWN